MTLLQQCLRACSLGPKQAQFQTLFEFTVLQMEME